jgi:hypothetical protein
MNERTLPWTPMQVLVEKGPISALRMLFRRDGTVDLALRTASLAITNLSYPEYPVGP